MQGLELNDNGTIKNWNLSAIWLTLPENFGNLIVTGNLGLSNNNLQSLPDSFGSITVGGDLSLTKNQLNSEDIPKDFTNVKGTVTLENSWTLL